MNVYDVTLKEPGRADLSARVPNYDAALAWARGALQVRAAGLGCVLSMRRIGDSAARRWSVRGGEAAAPTFTPIRE